MDLSSRGTPGAPPRVLQYRKHIRAMEKPFKYFMFCYFLLFFMMAIFYFYSLLQNNIISIVPLLGAGLLWIPLFLEYKYIIRPLAISKIQVYPDRLFIDRGKEKIDIPFDEIKEIKSAVNKYLGGWFKVILKNKKSYRFTIALERVDYIIDGIIKFNPLLLNDDDYKKLRKNLILADHCWARCYDFFQKKNIAIALFYLLLIPAILIIAIYFKQQSEFLIKNPIEYFGVTSFLALVFLGLVGTIFPFLAFVFINKHADKRIDENPNNKARDQAYEVKIYRKFLPLYLATLLIYFACIYQFDLNAVSFAYISKDAKYFAIKASDPLWVDMKYNCLDCKHSLKKGDVIVTDRLLLGKIVAIPKEKVAISNRDDEGRFMASTEEEEVPLNFLAIYAYDGEIVLLDIKDVKGKIILPKSN